MKKISLFILFSISMSLVSLAQTKKTNKAKPAAKPAAKHTTIYASKAPVAKNTMVEISTIYGKMVVKLYNETPIHRDNFIKLVKEGFYDSLLFHRIIKSFMIQGGDPLSKTADSNAMLGAGDIGYKLPAEINPELFHKRGALAAARDNNPEKMSSGCQFYIVQGRTYTAKELESILNNRNMTHKQEILYKIYQSDTVQATLSAFQNMGDKDQTRTYMDKVHVVVDQTYKTMYPDAEKPNQNQVQTYLEFGGAPHLDGSYTVFGELVSGFDVLDAIANTQTKPGDRPVTDLRMKMRLL
ncbi:MAG: peptidylprolyl isomerase [bacterium]|nr:peptidylprolyl isomerase [bacterium]